MGIPNLLPFNLEVHLQTMKTHSQYRPTANDLIEAQQQSEELSTKTSFLGSIIIWCILFVYIIIIIFFLCYFFSSFKYFYKTFLTAINQANSKSLWAYLIKFFLNYTQNPTPEIQA